jgi:AAA domain
VQALFARGDKRPDPLQVFTPSKAVREDMFASRHYENLQENFELAVEQPGHQIVLYGDTGVGKTSLVSYLASTKKLNVIRVECGNSFEEMLKEALAIAGVTEDKFEIIAKQSGQAGVRGSLGMLFSRWQREDSEQETKTSYPVSIATTVREALTAVHVDLLFLDNFENLRAKPFGPEVSVEIIQLMKSCSDREGNGVKVVVAGIPAESEALVALDEATARRTAQIEVPRMPDEELDEIIRNGERILEIEFDADCRTLITRYSDGFPYYTHLHALQAVLEALKEPSDRVTVGHFMSALTRILKQADLALRRAYEDAVETTGKIRTRKSVLEAMATFEKQEVTFREIKAAFWKIHPQYQNLKALDFINPYLTQLISKYAIVQSRGIPRSADRRYRFRNPLMRGYIRLKQQEEAQGQLPLDG